MHGIKKKKLNAPTIGMKGKKTFKQGMRMYLCVIDTCVNVRVCKSYEKTMKKKVLQLGTFYPRATLSESVKKRNRENTIAFL